MVVVVVVWPPRQNSGSGPVHNRPMICINATTRRQISVYLIMILISLLVPRACKKNCTPFFPNVGVQKKIFPLALLANHVLSPHF